MSDRLPSPTDRPGAVGVLGARGLVGRFLIPRLREQGHPVLACSRMAEVPTGHDQEAVWCRVGGPLPRGWEQVPVWIATCPIWGTVDLLEWLAAAGAKRLVAISSTSMITKQHSGDRRERLLAQRLAVAEAEIGAWSIRQSVTAAIMRPTMIYDGTNDANVAAIAACVRRFGWFPLCGRAHGLRQPVHADDVASACLAAAIHPAPRSNYTISGGEQLPFRELVERTCRSHGLTPRTASLPPVAWRLAAGIARGLGLTAAASAAVGSRMNDDLVFSHADAAADLGFRPRPFAPGDRNPDPGPPPAPSLSR